MSRRIAKQDKAIKRVGAARGKTNFGVASRARRQRMKLTVPSDASFMESTAHEVSARRPSASLKEFAKLLHEQTGVAGDAAHREGVNRVMARTGQNALTIAHDDVLSLTNDSKSGFL